MSSLEHHYRRLLRWYPADHRRRHEDEMLGVLLATAEPGQERPGVRDRADLLLGAVEIRLGRALSGLTKGWWDTLALISVVAPVLLLSQQVTDLLGLGLGNLGTISFTPLGGVPAAVWGIAIAFMLIAAVIAAAALRGARITAAALSWAFLGIWVWTQTAAFQELGFAYEGLLVQIFLVLTVLALTLGPGPVRGLELIGLRRLMHLGLVATGAFILNQVALFSSLPWLSALQLVPPVVFAVLAGLAMGRSVTRRAAAVLALPVFLNLWMFGLTFSVPLAFVLPGIAFLVVATRTIHRSTDRSGSRVAV